MGNGRQLTQFICRRPSPYPARLPPTSEKRIISTEAHQDGPKRTHWRDCTSFLAFAHKGDIENSNIVPLSTLITVKYWDLRAKAPVLSRLSLFATIVKTHGITYPHLLFHSLCFVSATLSYFSTIFLESTKWCSCRKSFHAFLPAYRCGSKEPISNIARSSSIDPVLPVSELDVHSDYDGRRWV